MTPIFRHKYCLWPTFGARLRREKSDTQTSPVDHDDDGSRTILFINIKTKFSRVQQFPTSLAAYGAGNATGNDE
jgi:hypothetical protein